MNKRFRIFLGATGAVALLSSCAGGFDPDMRGWFPGALNTADAAAKASPRPEADDRGVISFPDYQVAVARAGDTPATVASRLGLDAEQLARHNALPATTPLNEGAILLLPQRVRGGSTTGGGFGQIIDPFANGGTPQSTAAGSDNPNTATPATAPVQPKQHQVAAGETAWSIARKYNVTIQDLAEWNGLPANMSLRVGQRLIIPVTGQEPPGQTGNTTAPGQGSPTPRPPSSDEPLPGEKTAPAADPGPQAEAPNLGATRTAASAGGRFNMPVAGSIIRVYEKGKNEGIDIAASSGAGVKAAGSGQVAAITRDTGGTPIVVVRHNDGLMTVYTGLGDLSVSKGDSVSAGQQIGTAGGSGSVHFEVRRGFESVDPEEYL